MSRSDVHRPSAIVPADYYHVLTYGKEFAGLAGPEDRPVFEWFNMDEAERTYAQFGARVHPGVLACDHCGARFKYGSLYRHRETGEVISVGHQCAALLDFYFDTSAEARMRKANADARAIVAMRRDRRRSLRTWIEANAELRSLLKTDHRIVRDMRYRLIATGAKWGLSDAQVRLLRKLRDDAGRPQAARVPVPDFEDDRVSVEGRVVSTKVDTFDVLRMTIEVEADGGSWLTWGSVPSALLDGEELKGRRVAFYAQITRSDRDAHFSFFKRPTRARFV